MTPCERLGYKVGDLFEVVEEGIWSRGSVVKLTEDDGSNCPRFKLYNGTLLRQEYHRSEELYENLKRLAPLERDYVGYTKIEHPDGRIEFIPQGALQGGTKEEPKAPENYIDWDAKEGGEAYYSQIDHHVLPLSSCDGDDYMQECLLDSYKLYPTRELASKANKLRERSDAIIKACLLVDPYFRPDYSDENTDKHHVYYAHNVNLWRTEGWTQIAESVACVSTQEKAEQVCELLTTWGIK